jgi:urocanate hydratase
MRRILTLAASAALGLAPAFAFAAPNQMQQDQTVAPAPSNGSIPDGTIGKAGAALHDVAKLQEKYQGKMESASPEQKQGLSAQANAEAVQAIQSHGLSVQEYSNVVRTAQNNPQVKQRLLSAANSEP